MDKKCKFFEIIAEAYEEEILSGGLGCGDS